MTDPAPELPAGRPRPGSTAEIVRLALPLVLANSFMTVQVTIDRVLLSQHHSDDIAAALPAVMYFWTALTLLQQTCAYATAFVAQYVGAGRPSRVGPAVWQAVWFALAGGVAFLGLVPLAGPLMSLTGHEPSVRALEVVYFRCLCYSALPVLLTAAVSAFFAGRGDSWTVLVVNAAGTLVNGVLAFAWVSGRFGFPEMGIAGAGLATVVASWVSACVAFALLLRPRHRREFATLSGWRPDWPLFGRLLYHGVPTGLQWAFDGLAFSVFLILVGRMGAAEQAAVSIAITINMFAFMPMLGVGQAVEILTGQRLGQDRPDLAVKSTWAAFRVGLAYMAAMSALYVLTPRLFTYWFENADPAEAEKWAAIGAIVPVLLRFVAVYSLFDTFNAVFSFALRGAGDTRFVTAVSLALAWPMMVVPTWAAWYYGWGLYWPWGFASAYIIAMAGVFCLRFLQGKWQSMRVIEAAPPDVPAPAGEPEGEPVGAGR